jgi:hypothetical protein
MKKESVKIGELNFELTTADRDAETEEPTRPVLEVENDASMVYLKIEKSEAIRLRRLLDQFIQASS